MTFFFLIVFCFHLPFFAVALYGYITDKKLINTVSDKTKYKFISYFVLLAAGIIGILNFGWLRMFTCIFVYAYSFLLFFTVSCASGFAKESREIKTSVVVSYISFLSFQLFMPDVDDVKSHAVFGLIKNDIGLNICYVLAGIMAVINIIAIILMVIETEELKKAKKDTTGDFLA